MSISCSQLKETLPNLITEVRGDVSASFKTVSPADTTTSHSIVFVHQEKYLKTALSSSATILVTTGSLANQISETSKTILVSPNVYLAMAKTLQTFFPEFATKKGDHHPTAIISRSAKVSSDAYIGPYCIVGDHVQIEAGACLESHVTVEAHATIGSNTHILPHVYIGPRTQIGSFCEIKAQSVVGGEGFGFAPDEKGQHHRIPQKGRVVLENNVFIGSLCAIDRATLENGETRIGEGTKIDNQLQIAHNVKIGRHCVFAGGTVIAGSATIGNHCVVGGHSSIAGHITIGDKVHLGGRSGVTGNIDKPGAYTGLPLQPLRDHLKTEAYLKQLPQFTKKVQKLLKKLGLVEDSE